MLFGLIFVWAGSSWFPQTPPSGQIFIPGASTRKSLYKCAKFQVPSSISYTVMEGIPEYKAGAADLPRRPLAVKLLYVANLR